MFKRRFRLPSPALVISMVALSLVLGGTAVAATATGGDKKADTKLIKKLAPTLSVKHAKSATNATNAANATHATSADSATSATNSTNAVNATNATNAANLGGVPASGYVANSGSIFISTGSSNWHSLSSADPITWSYTINATWATTSGAGSFILTAHPSIPTGLYGKNLMATAATLCYSASASADITKVEVSDSKYSTSGVGSVHDLAVDTTSRTDDACRVYPFSTPVTLTSLDDVGLAIFVSYSSASTLLIGQSGITLAPTTTAASAPKNATSRSGLASRAGIVTH